MTFYSNWSSDAVKAHWLDEESYATQKVLTRPA